MNIGSLAPKKVKELDKMYVEEVKEVEVEVEVEVKEVIDLDSGIKLPQSNTKASISEYTAFDIHTVCYLWLKYNTQYKELIAKNYDMGNVMINTHIRKIKLSALTYNSNMDKLNITQNVIIDTDLNKKTITVCDTFYYNKQTVYVSILYDKIIDYLVPDNIKYVSFIDYNLIRCIEPKLTLHIKLNSDNCNSCEFYSICDEK